MAEQFFATVVRSTGSWYEVLHEGGGWGGNVNIIGRILPKTKKATPRGCFCFGGVDGLATAQTMSAPLNAFPYRFRWDDDYVLYS